MSCKTIVINSERIRWCDMLRCRYRGVAVGVAVEGIFVSHLTRFPHFCVSVLHNAEPTVSFASQCLLEEGSTFHCT